jgi:uncharacterized protein YaaN involved in tellurite resistance
MKITKVGELPNILKIKNKEDFSNRLIQEVLSICKNHSIFSKATSRITKLNQYKENLDERNQKLDSLIDKSNKTKMELQEKIKFLDSNNNKIKSKLIQILEEKNNGGLSNE